MKRDWRPSERAEIWLSGLSQPEEEDNDAEQFAALLRNDAPLDAFLYSALCAAAMPFRGREEEGPSPIELVDDWDELLPYESCIKARLALTARHRGRPSDLVRSLVVQQDFMKALNLEEQSPIKDMSRPSDALNLRTLNRRVFYILVGRRINSDRKLRDAIAEGVDPIASTPWRLRIEQRARRPKGGQRYTELGRALREWNAIRHSNFDTSAQKKFNRFDKNKMEATKNLLSLCEKTIRTRVRSSQKRNQRS